MYINRNLVLAITQIISITVLNVTLINPRSSCYDIKATSYVRQDTKSLRKCAAYCAGKSITLSFNRGINCACCKDPPLYLVESDSEDLYSLTGIKY